MGLDIKLIDELLAGRSSVAEIAGENGLLSCIPAVVMQKASQGPNSTKNADNANFVQVAYFL